MSLAASNTTENRPVVNTRHEPHGTHYRRIHVISADANELPGANALKIGMGNMVNRLIAHGAQLDHLYLRDPVRAFREFGEDMTFTHTAETLDGKRLTALDIEEQFVDLVAQLEEQTGILTDEEWKILWWQQELIDALRKSGDHSALVGVADWATKYDLMMDRPKDEALKVAIGWGSLGKGSLSTWKIESGQFELPLDFSMDEVRRYVHEAPAGRAQRRGALITKLAGLGHTLETAEVDFSWARIRTPNVWRARPIDLGTPFGDTPTEEQIDMWVQERVPDLRDKEAYRQFIGIRDEGIIDYD